MSGKDRIWYIYEYYKFHIVAVILAFTLLWVVGSSLYRQTFTTRLTFAIVNDRSGGESSMDEFENSLKEALGFGKKDLIEINSDCLSMLMAPSLPNIPMQVWQRLLL